MFFVSLLLNQTIGWMRTRPGTSSLRAMLYIDEIFGFMPPVAEPPTKKPLLTLLKQARAFGLGCVLATQNPMDLDYKGLSNTGTWFIGRLQTDRDKQRVLDGLEGATNESGQTFDRSTISEVLSAVGKRVFLMHNVHEEGPAVFHTRWALSYLSGPMTRDQIKRLMKGREASVPDPHAPHKVAGSDLSAATLRPVLPPDVPQLFLPQLRHPGEDRVVYRPHLLALGRIHFVDTRKGLSANEDLTLLVPLQESVDGLDWEDGQELALLPDDFEQEPEPGAEFGKLISEASTAKSFSSWAKSLEDHIYRSRRFHLFKSPTLREFSEPGGWNGTFVFGWATKRGRSAMRRSKSSGRNTPRRFALWKTAFRAPNRRSNSRSKKPKALRCKPRFPGAPRSSRLFLDEPTIGLDVAIKERIRRFIQYINTEEDSTIILTTHDMVDIEELCPRLIIIDEGRILFDGAQDEIKERFGRRRRVIVNFHRDYLPDYAGKPLPPADMPLSFGSIGLKAASSIEEVKSGGEPHDDGGPDVDGGQAVGLANEAPVVDSVLAEPGALQFMAALSGLMDDGSQLRVRRLNLAQYQISFDRMQHRAKDVLGRLLEQFEVDDLQLHEPELSDIVRAIYEGRHKEVKRNS